MALDTADIGRLVDEYGRAVFGFCRSIAGSRADAEDLYQRTFLRALELAGRIDEGNNPRSFLLSIAVALTKNDRRKGARRERIAPTSAMEDGWESVADGGKGPEEAIAEKELSRMVGSAVESLGDDLRLPVVLFYSLELPVGEIAQVLKLPQGTVKSRLYRARDIIRRELEARGYAGI